MFIIRIQPVLRRCKFKKSRCIRVLKILIRLPWRTLFGSILVLFVLAGGYQIWQPGKHVTDGRHDLGHNGIWLQHGWLGDSAWFQRVQKDPRMFQQPSVILRLKQLLHDHHITDLYPHVAPCAETGEIAGVDARQMQQFLSIMDEFRVIPRVGGVLDVHAFPASTTWRQQFIASIRELLHTYPILAGIHVNIEPLPLGD